MHLVIVTNLMPKRFDAYTVGFLILVRPQFKDDEALIAHEATHVRQFWRTFGLAGLFYWLSQKKRYEYELEAYKAQLKYRPERINSYASYLATNYNVGVSFLDAKADLMGVYQ